MALGLINPLLALAATIETGPGQDSNCAQTLQLAAKGVQAALLKATPTNSKNQLFWSPWLLAVALQSGLVFAANGAVTIALNF